jgi:D-alanyl-D-alanine carboxypeptidase (penicillin-binding protein 4)
VLGGLAIAGVTGTLADRFYTESSYAGAGVVHAKTGTLTGVSSLAGTVVDREGRLLVFAFTTNSAADVPSARASLDDAATVLARCGCQPG